MNTTPRFGLVLEVAHGTVSLATRIVAIAGAIGLAACGSTTVDGPANGSTNGVEGGAPPAGSGGILFGDAGGGPAAPSPATVAEVFGHSDTTLYRLDPDTKKVTVVGPLRGCSDGPLVDIALDKGSRMFGVSDHALYAIDKTTAACTLMRSGDYPNALSFIPAGVLDPANETLVGFVGGTYVRIDTTSGAKTEIGQLADGYESSGDIVSVIGGGTYLTVKGDECDDCLVEIDPKTGAMKKNFGSLGYSDVFGLSFWGGSAYGFTMSGQLFEVKLQGGQASTSPIAIPSGTGSVSFWGAGSTTSAPVTAIR